MTLEKIIFRQNETRQNKIKCMEKICGKMKDQEMKNQED